MDPFQSLLQLSCGRRRRLHFVHLCVRVAVRLLWLLLRLRRRLSELQVALLLLLTWRR